MRSGIAVALGGALGAWARYGVAHVFGTWAFPWATLVLNATGSFAPGLLAGVAGYLAG